MTDTAPLSAAVSAPGRITLALSGDLSAERLEALRTAIAAAGKLIADEQVKTGAKVRVLLDMSAFTGAYDVAAMDMLAALAAGDTNLVAKTAAFGGPTTGAMAGEIVSALARRDNIKFFGTQAEAEAWLA